MKTLIIRAELSIPPSESLAFRFLTLSTKYHLSVSNLIQIESPVKDFYYHWMKQRGLYDFIAQIVTPEEVVEGILLGPKREVDYDRILFSNVKNILGRIECLTI